MYVCRVGQLRGWEEGCSLECRPRDPVRTLKAREFLLAISVTLGSTGMSGSSSTTAPQLGNFFSSLLYVYLRIDFWLLNPLPVIPIDFHSVLYSRADKQPPHSRSPPLSHLQPLNRRSVTGWGARTTSPRPPR